MYYTPVSAAEQQVLEVIAEHQPMHGSAVIRTSGLARGTVYSCLRTLRNKKLIVGRLEGEDSYNERQGRGAARVLYSTPRDLLDHFPAVKLLVLKRLEEIKNGAPSQP